MNIGKLSPDLEIETTHGKLRLSQLRGKKVILYFYPKAFTSGCTRELQRFVELYDDFKKLNAEVIGVSVDDLETVKKFAEKYGARFPLAADKDKVVANTYGVLNDRGTSAQRITFVLDEKGRVIEILRGLRKAEEHADRALEVVRKGKP